MPVLLERALKALGAFEFKAKPKEEFADKWLGAFKGAVPEGTTSTEYLKSLRETGYGKY